MESAKSVVKDLKVHQQYNKKINHKFHKFTQIKICRNLRKSAVKYLKAPQQYNKKINHKFHKSTQIKICGICGKRFKSTSAVKQKNQPQISQNYANPNLWNLW